MSHFTIVLTDEFKDILRIYNSNVKGKDKIMFGFTAIKSIKKKNETMI